MGSPLEPKPGLVIRYAYLWRSEADRGRDEGSKDRPCAVVLATKRKGDEITVVVAPLTHSPPQNQTGVLEVPAATKQRLKLDEGRSWIITHEVNIFTWPGPDIRPADPRHPENGIVFGYLPGPLTQAMIDGVRQEMQKERTGIVKRDESSSSEGIGTGKRHLLSRDDDDRGR